MEIALKWYDNFISFAVATSLGGILFTAFLFFAGSSTFGSSIISNFYDAKMLIYHSMLSGSLIFLPVILVVLCLLYAISAFFIFLPIQTLLASFGVSQRHAAVAGAILFAVAFGWIVGKPLLGSDDVTGLFRLSTLMAAPLAGYLVYRKAPNI
ncbi:MAG: hypothetical protein AAF503_11530 [Pseudomonadota bacterium]